MCIAAALVGVAVVATGVSMSQAEDAEDAQYEAAQEQKKAQNEQRAVNLAQAAKEKRAQLREERIKRARLTQLSENTGTSDSSGFIGASSGMATQLGANLGFNTSLLNSSENISIFSQASADSMSQANKLGAESQMWGQIGSLAMTGASMFGGGGKSSPKKE